MNTYQWDATEHLDSKEAIAAYLGAVFEDGDLALIKAALSDMAKARGMTEIVEKAGYTRAGLYKALGENGNPSLDLVTQVLKALGVKMMVAAPRSAIDDKARLKASSSPDLRSSASRSARNLSYHGQIGRETTAQFAARRAQDQFWVASRRWPRGAIHPPRPGRTLCLCFFFVAKQGHHNCSLGALLERG